MTTTIKISLSSGKEIELDEKEYKELKEALSEIKTHYIPYDPSPITPPYPTDVWYGPYTPAESTTTTSSTSSVGDCVKTDTIYGENFQNVVHVYKALHEGEMR